MKLQKVLMIGTLVGAFAGLAPAAEFINASLANGVYFGTGNPNSGFTVLDTTNTVSGDVLEMGLSATVQFQPSAWADGNTYDVPPTSTGKASWDFVFSVDTNSTDQANGDTLSAYTYNIVITDTTTGSTASFDPTTLPDNAQILANGTNACGDTPNQCAYNGGNTGMQNAEKISFSFISSQFSTPYSSAALDLYTVALTATPQNGSTITPTLTIDVQVTPEPSTWLLLAAGVPLFWAVRRRGRRA